MTDEELAELKPRGSPVAAWRGQVSDADAARKWIGATYDQSKLGETKGHLEYSFLAGAAHGRAAERERCAKLAEESGLPGPGGLDITNGIPPEIYIAIGRGRYDGPDDDGNDHGDYDLARDTAETVRQGIAAAIRSAT